MPPWSTVAWDTSCAISSLARRERVAVVLSKIWGIAWQISNERPWLEPSQVERPCVDGGFDVGDATVPIHRTDAPGAAGQQYDGIFATEAQFVEDTEFAGSEHDGEQLGCVEYAEQFHIVTAAPETLRFGADAHQAAIDVQHAPAQKVVEESVVFLQERTQFRVRDRSALQNPAQGLLGHHMYREWWRGDRLYPSIAP